MVPRNSPTGFRLTPVGCQGKLSCCSSTQSPTLLAAPVPAPSLQMPTPSPGLPRPCSTAPPPSARSLPPEAAAPRTQRRRSPPWCSEHEVLVPAQRLLLPREMTPLQLEPVSLLGSIATPLLRRGSVDTTC